MKFTKMEGLGNDYIYLDCTSHQPPDLPALAVRLSDRHFGVGGDGLICIKPGLQGDFCMEMYNADGSRGSMCGNGIRCVGKYVYDNGLTRKTCLSIDTDAGQRGLELSVREGKVRQVTVDMGVVRVFPAIHLQALGESYTVIQADAGNPHAVIFCADPGAVALERIGPVLESHPDLLARSNIEFVSLCDPDQIHLRVWERGSGITLACGTGACAAFAVAQKLGRCSAKASVHLPGGILLLEQKGERIFMTGPACTVFHGEIVL